MKLLTKTQVYYLSLLLILLIFWSGVFLYAISLVLKDSIDETLYSELQATIEQFQDNDAGSFLNYAKKSPLLDYTYIEFIHSKKLFYSDTLLFNSVEQEDIPYRQVHAEIRAAGKPVRITLRKSLIEYDDLFSAILITELILIFLLVAGMYVLNRSILEKIWQPFFTTLQKISEFRINKNTQLILPETNIQEFEKLNLVLEEMMEQIKQDYKSLKQFTENASHEIQTPLAIITSRIEVLLQENKLGEEGWDSLREIYEAAGRLSRLNKALLLLTKIENRQFNSNETVEIGELILSLLPEYEEQIAQKKLVVISNIKKGIQIEANQELIQVLVRNLFSNSIRHNVEGGTLFIRLTSESLMISNSGNNDELNPEKYFGRFYKKSKNPYSLGLGLAIVKEICELNGFEYTYTIEDQKNIVKIRFKEFKAEQ